MQQTSNLKLKKPDYTDTADVNDFNENMDIIDETINEHISNTNNPHKVTKAQLGLENVDNTADANKNVLSATKLTATRLTSESLNDVIEIGDYWGAGGNTVTDFPDGASTNGTTVGGFTLVVKQAGGLSRLQIYTSNKGTWFRIGSLSGSTTVTWEEWIKIYNSANPAKINGTAFNGTDDITVTASPNFTALVEKDLNTVKNNGFYGGGSGNNCTNLPTGVSTFLLIVSRNTSGTGYTQIVVNAETRYMYVRNYYNQKWQDWRNVSIPINAIQRYNCSEKIAEGLDVYSIGSIDSDTVTLFVNKNYGIGDSFGLIIDSDSSVTGDITLELNYNGTTIHSGIIDDDSDNSLSDFEGNILYKVTLKSSRGGYAFEKSETSTVATVAIDRQLNTNDVFFLDFTYASGTIAGGMKLQTSFNGEASIALSLYDTDNKKVTAVETNRMYLIKKKSNGFYMMKIG